VMSRAVSARTIPSREICQAGGAGTSPATACLTVGAGATRTDQRNRRNDREQGG
jgi:hypothetical protein